MVAHSGQPQPASPRAIEDPEAYAVYASLIPEEWPVRAAGAKRLVVRRETASYDQCLPQPSALPAEWQPVLDSFKTENARVRIILPERQLGRPYIVVPTEQIMSMFENRPLGDWEEFYDRYPDSGGFMEMSAVGFDGSKTHALVYIAHHCGGTCGGGTHHFLEKVDGVWRTAKVSMTQCIWIS
jgi:hypothetical protein